MWTKAEMAKLTVEQQEVLARFELSIARQRQKLLEEARGYRGSFPRNLGIAALIGIPLGAIFLLGNLRKLLFGVELMVIIQFLV